MKRRLSVSVGIPALNEERNIGELVHRLLSQKQIGFSLREIIVASDGSTDATVSLLQSMNSPLLRIIDGKKRIGQQKRQNQILRSFRSDILVLIEADTLPVKNTALSDLIQPFLENNASSRIGMTIGESVPISPSTLMEKIMSNGSRIKSRIFSEWRNGDNVYSSGGNAMRALSSSFAKKMSWPGHVPEDSYIFFRAKQLGFRIVLQKRATTYFRCVRDFSDGVKKNKKFLTGISALKTHFPTLDIDREFSPPLFGVFKHLFLAFCRNPLLTFLYVSQIVLKRVLLFRPEKYSALYHPYTSTKDLRADERENQKPSALQRAYDSLAPAYDHRAFFERPGLRYLHDWEITVISSLLPRVKQTVSILDQGVGTGRIAHLLLRNNYSVVGLDFSSEMLEQARKKLIPFQKNGMVGLLTHDLHARLPFPDASFGGVICVRVIKYIRNWKQLIHESGRVVRPGGFYLLELPNRLSVQSFSALYNPYRTFLASDVENELHSAGFRVQKRLGGKKLPFSVYRFLPDALFPLAISLEDAMRNIFRDAGSRNFIYYCIKV